jgi:hypothetical protein
MEHPQCRSGWQDNGAEPVSPKSPGSSHCSNENEIIAAPTQLTADREEGTANITWQCGRGRVARRRVTITSAPNGPIFIPI